MTRGSAKTRQGKSRNAEGGINTLFSLAGKTQKAPTLVETRNADNDEFRINHLNPLGTFDISPTITSDKSTASP